MTNPPWEIILLLFILCFLVLMSLTRSADSLMPRGYEHLHVDSSFQVPLNATNDLSDTKHSRELMCPSKKAEKKPIAPYTGTAFSNCTLLRNEKEPLLNIGSIHAAPFVIESHKLLLFVIRKVASREFITLARRLMGLPAWNVSCRWSDVGLVRLHEYAPNKAEQMFLSDVWTRAVFVRDPKERVLSAYLNKIHKVQFLQQNCCRRKNKTVQNLLQCHVENVTKLDLSFADFVQYIVPGCPNYHWIPQSHLLRKSEWKKMNFVGNFDRIEADGRRLLERIRAWESYGEKGWHDGSIFHGGPVSSMYTGANGRLRQYYTSELEKRVEAFYQDDYNLPVFNLSRYKIFTEEKDGV